jgi:hypothetical protein
METEDSSIHGFSKGPTLGFSDIFSYRDMWQEIAKEFHGEFKVKLTAGNEIESHVVTIPYKKWNIGISLSDTRPLKFQISFHSNQDFRLTLGWEDFIERIWKHFGKPDIEFGWEEFDKRYLVKSNRPDWTRKVITKDIQKMLLKHNVYSLSYQSDPGSKSAELVSVIEKNAGKKEMLVDLIEMFKLLIDNLKETRII